MNENQMEVLIHSNGYEKRGDLLSFSPNESSSENDNQTNSDTLALGLAIVDDIWNTGEVPKNSELVDKHPKNDNDEICTSPKPMPLVILDEFNPCNEQNCVESETPSSSISGLLEPDVSMYTDKNVVECETPDLVAPGGVKDICVDTGAVPLEKTLIESNKDDHDGVFESINGDQDSNNFANWETFESVEPEESRIFQEENVDENSSVLFCTSVPKIDEQQSISSSDNSIADIVSDEESSSISSTRVSGEFIMQESLLNSLKQEDDKTGQQSDEVPSLDTIMESLAVMFNSKDIKKEDQMSKLSYNSKVEKGTITFDFKSSIPDVPNFVENDTNAELVNGKSTEPLDEKEKTKDQSVSNDVEITNSTISTRTEGLLHPQVESVNGESSFSVSEPVSGLITYSGQIAHAGSTSIRSDSSTTSTRSFAFPVLQSEWNSSPVRMQKASPRRRRNHWHGYFCCRF